MTIEVVLVRHASTEWNEDGRIQGRSDIPLSARGRADASTWRVDDFAGAPVQWLSSPLQRAVETARLLGGAEPRRAEALIEMHWGDWEGLTLAGIRAQWGARMTAMEAQGLDFRPPGGESPRDLQARVLAFFAHCAATQRGPIFAVTHRGVLRAVLAAATGWDMTGKPPIRLRDDAMHRFTVNDGGAVAIGACNVALRSA